jgi:predicted helicase
MRYNLLKTFDKIYIINLHGNAKKKETAPDGSEDKNVFDIQQGVSINIFVKTDSKGIHPLATIYHYDLFGKRPEKYSFLLNNDLQSVKWNELQPAAPNYLFVQNDFSLQEEYSNGLKINELFMVNSLGIITKRDNLSIGFHDSDLKNKILYFLDETKSTKEVCDNFSIPIIDNDKWNAEKTRKTTNKNTIDAEIKNIMYRPFDTRKIFYNEQFVARLNKKVLGNLNKSNVALIIGRQGQAVGSNEWDIVFITNYLSDQNIFRRGGGTVFPLYLYQENFGQTEKVVNMNESIVKEFAAKIGVEKV